MVELLIDSKKVQMEPGKTLLQACQKLNIPIPTLCFHQALSPYGACRLCVVEVDKNGRRSIQASCMYPVESGLEVRTDTDELKNIRRLMIELIMARAPDSEKVRDVAARLGVTKTRFTSPNEGCILCGLCVRVCSERMGRSVLGFAKRGDQRKVAPPFDASSPVCMACGACFSVCPTAADLLKKTTDKVALPVLDEFDQGLRKRSAIYIPFPQAVPNLAIVDEKRCVHLATDQCQICTEFCEAGAIDFKQKEEIIDINVGAIILSCGFDEYDARGRSEYGYGRYANVVTSIEFERILSASGPYGGHIVRPSDHAEPRRIAFVQCVGSRDPHSGKSYCSSVCCTCSIKEAIIAKEHSRQPLDTTIFFIDIRTSGKGFETYYERARSEHGVRFVRAGISKISEAAETKNLIVCYESESGEIKQEEFDLVVLAVGLVPKDDTPAMAKRLRVLLNDHGFLKTSEFMPVDTVTDGVYTCGVASGPKDIPESVTQASAAAAKAMGLLASARKSLTSRRAIPAEVDTTAQESRIAVFVCHCGINIGGYVNVPEVIEYVRSLPDVIYAEHNLYTCSQDTQKRIVEVVREHKANRVVVASCTPRTHEALFRETIQEAGLNPYLFEMANIRDQCSWIHMNAPDDATAKAKDLVNMAVCKARLLRPLKRVEIPVIQKAVVIGGGIAGMTASLSLARQGFEVFLIEREPSLGGHLRHIFHTLEGRNVQNFVKSITEEVQRNERIRVFTGAVPGSIKGFVGNYETEVRTADGGSVKIEHGVVIVATGASEHVPDDYLFGKDKRVVTQKDFEKMIQDPGLRHMLEQARSVVMIQCVGSRDEAHQYCSRICCSQAVKNALRLYELAADINVYVFYRDVRTYGFSEDYYRKAREAGVIFIRYDDDRKPAIETRGDTLSVSLLEPILGEVIELNPDIVVLSAGIEANKDNGDLAKMLKVPLNSDGFFLEAHVKLRPVDFATEGIFVAGMAHSPKSIDETISQAEASAARAATIIAHDKYYAEAAVSYVDEDLCAGCGVCSKVCPYEAIEIVTENERRKSHVNEALCKGCGTCVSACPSGAMEQYGFTRRQIHAMVEALEHQF
ncbi:FAD-dependent oxidoreductase [candidate division WOR-3 bacterium]|nr:FAD-dependent oxidoreductase [candidate division WOR-3 bacterium]